MRDSLKLILFFIAAALVAVFAGKVITATNLVIPLVGVFGIFFTLISFSNPKHGLILLIYAMLLSPEIVLARLPGREVAIRFDDYLLVILFITWFAHIATKKDVGIFQKSPLNLPIEAYVLACVLFTARAMLYGFVNPVKSTFYVFKYIEYFALYMMIINIVKDEKYLKQVLVSILVTYVAVAVYAYVLVAQGVPRIYAPFDVDVAAKSGESAALGGYLLIIMSILLGLFCYAPTFRFSAIMMGLFVFALIPFIYTLSRASFFAFVPMCGAILLFTKRRRPVLAIALVAGLVFSPLIFPKAVKDVTSRITETFQGSDMESRSVAGVQIKETSALLRVQSWNKALTSWAATQPFFGYGVTGVGMVDTQYPLTIGELGLIGFGIFIWLLVSVLINAVRIYNSINHWLARGLSLGLVAATLALMTQAVAVNTFITIRIAEPFWMLVGLVIALPEIFPGETRAEDYALKGESPL